MDVARILFKCFTLVQNMGKGIVPFVNDFVKDPKLKTVLIEREGIKESLADLGTKKGIMM